MVVSDGSAVRQVSKQRLIAAIIILVAAASIGLWKDAGEAERDEQGLLVRPGNIINASLNTKTRSSGPCGFQSYDKMIDYAHRLESIPGRTDCQDITANTTSINITAAMFSTSAKVIQRQSAVAIKQFGDVAASWITIRFTAYNSVGKPQTEGGDEFRITFWGSQNKQVTKTAAIATDKFNGSYTVRLLVPQCNVDYYRIGIHHWYTCFQGTARDQCVLTRYVNCANTPKFKNAPIEFGPVVLDEEQLAPIDLFNHGANCEDDSNNQELPLCPPSQRGVEQYTQCGFWGEKVMNEIATELTEAAEWVSSCCRLDPKLKQSEDMTIFRIGDSTMPIRTLQVGYPYSPLSFYQQYVDFLSSPDTDFSRSKPTDVMVFQAGLHQLHFGFRASEVVEVVLLMLCQLASVFTGKIVLLGPNPIQQHQQYPVQVDLRDGEVRIINSLLRERVVEQHGGRLLEICLSIPHNLTTLLLASQEENAAATRDESFLREYYTRAVSNPFFQNTNLTGKLGLDCGKPTCAGADFVERAKNMMREPELTSLFGGPREDAFVQAMRKVDFEESFGNRTVWVTDLQSFLLSRDDMYRENDKIHDLKGAFFWTHHARLINNLALMRSFGDE